MNYWLLIAFFIFMVSFHEPTMCGREEMVAYAASFLSMICHAILLG